MAEPPAPCRTCGTAASNGGNDGSRHGGGGGGNRHRERAAAEFPAWLPGADRHSATGSGCSSRLSSPPRPLSHTTIKTTKAVANDDGGGAGGGSSFRARRSGSGGVDDSRYRKHSALWGLVDPTGGTVYPHRCMLPHVTLVAGRRARRRRRRSGGGDNKALFGDSGALLISPLLLNGTVQLWHGHATTWPCEGQLRLLRQQERRHLGLRCGSGVRQGSVGPTSINSCGRHSHGWARHWTRSG